MDNMPLVCIITHTIYGESGTELMPPPKHVARYGYLSEPGEDFNTFSERMAGLVLPLRRQADAAPRRPYSERDSWSWSVYSLNPLPPT